ncbi:MAG: ECF transporter S component [Clostridia bacterium]|nr:ECF transporter S component [Clostridia bacterium]
MTKRSKNDTVGLVQLALFGAIVILIAFTPFIGYIPLGFTKATTIHIPVIIGSIILGPRRGAVLGFIFGLTSLINNTINPSLTSFVFTPFYSLGNANGNFLSLVICFVPRILVGIVPYYTYKAFSKLKANSVISCIIAGVLGSLTNTILVMNMIYFFFGEIYGKIQGTAQNTLYSVILSVILINGVPEAIVAAIITTFVVKAIQSARKVNL